MAYYIYRQNNSGGHYDIDLDVGLNVNVIVEATSEDEANTKAREIGIYFDGVRSGIDCECCGDRWCSPYLLEAEELIDYDTDSGVSIHRKENA
jgi:hypothetical protein